MTTIISHGFALAAAATLLTWQAPSAAAQSVKVAESSVRYEPDAAKRSLGVEFRLTDAPAVTVVRAAAEGGAEVPAAWEAFGRDKAPACAWLVIVDVSNPARARTVAKGVEFVKAFLGALPSQDQVAVSTLARDLSAVAPFGEASSAAANLGEIKASGDAALSTLIYENVREGLEGLRGRSEPRKAVLLLTDGKDETPGGAPAEEIAKNKLAEAARTAGVALHVIGYAEKASEQTYFGALKELARATDGLFIAAEVGNKEVSADTPARLSGAMHGAGTARLDLTGLETPVPLVLSITNAENQTAEFRIPEKEVAAALPAPEPEPTVVEPEPDPGPAAPVPEPEPTDAKPEPEPDPGPADTGTQAAKKAAEDKARRNMLIMAGGGLLLLLALVAVLLVRASRKRAAETARWEAEAEEARRAEDAQRAEVARQREAEAQKAAAKPLAWLEMCDAQQTRHPVRIPNLKIGRGQHNDLVLRNDSVSGNHCVLNCSREGQWAVTDLNAGNGVLVNGESIVQAPLRHGDVIELGELKMRFLLHA